jgi:hypothetical protein
MEVFMKKTLKILFVVCCLALCAISMVACTSISDFFNQATCDHEFDDGIVTKQATCSEVGVLTKTCTLCGAEETEDVEKIDHVYVEVPAVEPTCSKAGKTEGLTCKVCEAVLVEPQVLAPKGHVEVIDPAVEPGCLTPGATEGSHCKNCNEAVVKQTVIPAKGHDLVSVEQVSSTCDKAGHSAYSYCLDCDVKYGYEVYELLEHEFVDGSCLHCGMFDFSSFASSLTALNDTSKFTCTTLKINDTVKLSDVYFYGDNYFFELKDSSGNVFSFNPTSINVKVDGYPIPLTTESASLLNFLNGSMDGSGEAEDGLYMIPVGVELTFENGFTYTFSASENYTVINIFSPVDASDGGLFMYVPVK